MQRILLLVFLFFSSFQLSAQVRLSQKPADGRMEPMALTVHYLARPPLASPQNEELNAMPTGLEAEIFNEFYQWMRTSKRIPVQVTWKGHVEFEEFYNAVKEADPFTLGFGNVTITEGRKKEMDFSPPYLNNVSVLVTNGNVPTIHDTADIRKYLKGLTGVSTAGSVHAKYMDILRTSYLPNLNVEFVSDQNNIPRKVLRSDGYFGYVDIITYWRYIKDARSGYLKIHRFLNRGNENLGFIMPKDAEILSYINEFFESGFGFTSTKRYHDILEKYLGYEVISTVAIR